MRGYLARVCDESNTETGSHCFKSTLPIPGVPNQLNPKWFALSGFSYVTEFLAELGLNLGETIPNSEGVGFGASGAMWTSAQLVQAGNRLCSMSWDEVLRRVEAQQDKLKGGVDGEVDLSKAKAGFAAIKCFQVAHMAALLTDVLGFANDVSPMRYVKKMHDADLAWPVGAFLVDTSDGSVCEETPVPIANTNPHAWDDDLNWGGTRVNRFAWGLPGDQTPVAHAMFAIGCVLIGIIIGLTFCQGEQVRAFFGELGSNSKGKYTVGAASDPNDRLKRVSSLNHVWDAAAASLGDVHKHRSNPPPPRIGGYHKRTSSVDNSRLSGQPKDIEMGGGLSLSRTFSASGRARLSSGEFK